MLNRKTIERILIANGISPSAPDEEIRSVLLAAKWIDDDVEMALSVMRENQTHSVREDTVKNVFHSDEKLDSTAVSQLLAITLDTNLFNKTSETHNPWYQMSVKQWIVLLTIAVSITVVIAFAAILHLKTVEANALLS